VFERRKIEKSMKEKEKEILKIKQAQERLELDK
jgi:hypothetical protein